MFNLRQHADVETSESLSNRLRSRRFRLFERLIEPLPRPIRILDVGGRNSFWEQRGWEDRDDVEITLVNLEKEEQVHPRIRPVVGDATALDFPDDAFDVAFSNSVIEHVFTRENQEAMAREMSRVAKAVWVQTPNFWFPIEPHFHVPGWQWMPKTVRSFLLRRYRCGWRGPCPDPKQARALVDEVRLMSRRELRRAFPGANIIAERVYGLTKSWIVVDGFPPGTPLTLEPLSESAGGAEHRTSPDRDGAV